MEYNRECWIMMMSFPLDFWASDHIQNDIAAFGKLLTWEDDPSNLTRLLVKARVTDLEDVPKFIVFFLKLKVFLASLGLFSVK
jgi:hypothetical protein